MTQKKIWHLISNRWNSAITEYALSSARALNISGCSNVFTAMENSPADKRAKELGLETFPVKDFSWQTLGTLRNYAKNINADRILLYGGKETFLAKFLGKARYVRFFGQDLNTTLLRTPFLFSASYSHIYKFISPNDIISSDLQKKLSTQRIRRITLGLEAPTFKKLARLDRSEFVVLGRLDPVKGHESILRIFAKTLKKWPEGHVRPKLHIIGEEANLSSNQVSQWIEELNLNSHVLLTNKRVSDIQSVLHKACLGIVPSLGSEHICRVAEEFLLVGTPIFVSGAGATEEVLFSGAGQSYKGCDEEKAAQKLVECALQTLMEPESIREARANAARDLFSLETMGKNLKEFIFE